MHTEPTRRRNKWDRQVRKDPSDGYRLTTQGPIWEGDRGRNKASAGLNFFVVLVILLIVAIVAPQRFEDGTLWIEFGVAAVALLLIVYQISRRNR